MSPIQFQLMSDLHLETPSTRPTYSDFIITPRCANLALLGDIGNVLDIRLLDFLEAQLQQFQIVFFLLGNHEPYGSSFPAIKQCLREFETRVNRKHHASDSSFGRFVFLDQTRFDLTDYVTILGCTFFSMIEESQKRSIARFVDDFESIDDWTVDAHNASHEANRVWLNTQVANIEQDEPHRSIIILTHHSPTLLPEANDSRHLEDEAGVRSAFVTDVSRERCWTSASVRVWAFGHTHFNCDFLDAATGKRTVANRKGYRRSENVSFEVDKVIELEVSSVGGKVKATEKREEKAGKRRHYRCVVL